MAEDRVFDWMSPTAREFAIELMRYNVEQLYVTLELTNPVSRMAVQIQTTDYHMVGWAPRYLVADLVQAMAESPKYAAQVVLVNPQPAPSKQRVLIEMRGSWDLHEPMSGPEFRPLVT